MWPLHTLEHIFTTHIEKTTKIDGENHIAIMVAKIETIMLTA